MPVAGAIKLDIVTAANDKATATLRAIQGELRKTEEQIKQINATSEDSAFLSADEKSGLDGRRRKMFLEEAAALEQATRRRREQVLADREAKAEQLASASAARGFKGAVEGASKVQEFFNKTLGVAGFVGILGTAIVGLGSLVNELLGYGVTLDKIKAAQDALSAAIQETARIAFQLRLERVTPAEAERLKAERELLDLQVRSLTNAGAVAAARWVIAKADERILMLRKQQEASPWDVERGKVIEKEITELVHQRALALSSINTARANEQELTRGIQRLQLESSPLYASARDAVVALAGGMSVAADKAKDLQSRLGEIAANAVAANRDGVADAAAKDQEARAREAKAKADAAASEARATNDRIREIERQIAATRALAGVDDERTRAQIELELRLAAINEDRLNRRIKTQREADVLIEQAQVEAAAREEERRSKEVDAETQAFAAELAREEERSKKALERTEDLRRELAVLESGVVVDEARLEAARQLAELERSRAAGEVTVDEAAVQAELIARIADMKAQQEAANAETERSIELLGEYGTTAEQVGRAMEGLTGTFIGLGGNLTAITSLWADYERQQSKLGKSAADQAKSQRALGSAIAGTIGQTGEAIASGMEDRKAAAYLEGAFYAIASTAAFISGNVPVGLGYAGVALEFFALAGKGGGGKSGGGGGKGGGAPTTTSSGGGSSLGQSSGPFVSVVQQFGNGIVFGMAQEIGKASADAAYSLRGTGHDESRGFG